LGKKTLALNQQEFLKEMVEVRTKTVEELRDVFWERMKK
jgi:hypothetical protein